MATTLELHPPRRVDALVELAATLHIDSHNHRLWWRLPPEWQPALTAWADPFVVGLLFPMMGARQSVRIEGTVSPSLLENLERFMAIWACWEPGRYRPVSLSADIEKESPPPATDSVISPFSGGVDSCYTLLQHLHHAAGRRSRTVGAVAIMNGFDIWPNQPDAAAIFQGLLRDARLQLAPFPVPSLVLETNFHELPGVWGHTFGTQLISGLMLFANHFRGALVPNNQKFSAPQKAWGSTPLTDRYLGSTHFPIMDDAGEVSRSDKLRYIAQWPDVLARLRVCFPTNGTHQNCGICEKCVRNILGLRIAGLPVPKTAFPIEPTLRQIARMKFHSRLTHELWMELLKDARKYEVTHLPWARALAAAVRRGKRRQRWDTLTRRFLPLRNRLRTLFRGSPKRRARYNKAFEYKPD